MNESSVNTNSSSNNAGFDEVKIERSNVEVRTDSYFDGKLIELIGWNILSFLITAVTFGIAAPWGECMRLKFEIEHTVLNGKRLKFIGTGGSLFVEKFKWLFFSIITLGIYAFWIPVKKNKWVLSNIHFSDEEYVEGESFFDGKLIQLIGINIICNLLNVLSFGLLYTFTMCFRLRWLAKHSVINRKKLVFEGKAINLFGKYILWMFLTIITFGIYGFWLGIKMTKWEVKNTRIKLANEEYKKDYSVVWLSALAIILSIVAFTFVGPMLNSVSTNIQTDGYSPYGGSINDYDPMGTQMDNYGVVEEMQVQESIFR